MEKQKYHIHVYEVVKKADINIIAEDAIKAKEIALKFRNDLTYKDSDCEYIAIDFQSK